MPFAAPGGAALAGRNRPGKGSAEDVYAGPWDEAAEPAGGAELSPGDVRGRSQLVDVQYSSTAAPPERVVSQS